MKFGRYGRSEEIRVWRPMERSLLPFLAVFFFPSFFHCVCALRLILEEFRVSIEWRHMRNPNIFVSVSLKRDEWRGEDDDHYSHMHSDAYKRIHK